MKTPIRLFFTGILCLLFLLTSGCVMNKLSKSPEKITLDKDPEGAQLRIEVEKGESFTSRMQAGPFIFNVLPQIVMWAEDANGRFLETLYITGADFEGFRNASKKDKGSLFFKECFPLWASRLKEAGKTLPSPEQPYPDTVTSVTPSNSFTLKTAFSIGKKPFTLFLEINKSGDTNSAFTKENNDWVGQPALIFKTEITKPRSGESFHMNLAGHSGKINEKPAIYADISKFDTALRQIKKITINFK